MLELLALKIILILILRVRHLILSSLHEGLPNVLIESAVLKTFIISSNCETGPREILLNGKAGGLFRPETLNNWHKIIFFKNNKN